MNALENWYCSTSFWRWMTRERLLPWLLGQNDLGDHLLEIGAGAGAATAELCKRVPRVTSLDYNHKFATRIAQSNRPDTSATSRMAKMFSVVQADAASLPFAAGTFSCVLAILVLHHLRSPEMQDLAFAEIHRVLRPGGRLFLFDIPDGWFHRLIHTNSTFVPLHPASASARLRRVGFTEITLDQRPGGFSVRASRVD